MGVRVIKEGNKDKQGNAVCPHCGEIVLIDRYYGDPPRCPHCNIPYVPQPHPTIFTHNVWG